MKMSLMKMSIHQYNINENVNTPLMKMSLFPQIDRLERFAERAWYRIAKGEKLLSEAFSVLEDSKLR